MSEFDTNRFPLRFHDQRSQFVGQCLAFLVPAYIAERERLRREHPEMKPDALGFEAARSVLTSWAHLCDSAGLRPLDAA